VAATKKISKKKIAELNAELSVPHITASALRAMHNIENKDHRRDLVFVDSFHGHACTRCGCRFPETRPADGHSRSQSKILQMRQREREFTHNICSEDSKKNGR
jgi:hypothetical protein